VFVPSLTTSRFPSVRTGRTSAWLVPRHLFGPERYEGSDADERRLFYVAMTRARDWLSLSRHERIAKNRRLPIPPRGHRARRRTTAARATRADRPERYGSRAVTLTFSELAPAAPARPA
jgi:DNA helicase-2/ATP-dependent DNA helicase PcrA